MATRKPTTTRVGIRELRQNLGLYLRRVRRGDRIEVTDHGRPVALLAPLPPRQRSSQPLSGIDQWIAEGRATRGTGDLLDLGPPLPWPEGVPRISISEILDAQREDRL